ncbi:MAG: hypothetical protein ACOH5I_08355 [Oligoflexus sp.]
MIRSLFISHESPLIMNWFQERMDGGRYEDLFEYKRQAPLAFWAHPTADHLLPIFVAMGAGQGKPILQHQSVSYGSFAMNSWGWE